MEGWRAILSDCGYDDVISIPEDGKSNAYLFVMKTAGGADSGAAEAADTGGSQAGVAAGENAAHPGGDVLRSREKNRNYLELAAKKSNVRIEFYDEDTDLSKYDPCDRYQHGQRGRQRSGRKV